jgi:protein-S-isoprenylcysteine O-methyltransferase Ste14
MRPTTLLVGVVAMTVIFVLGPMGMVWLNEALDWPRWQTDIGRTVGTLLIVVGIGVVAYCSRLFARIGHGTPVPIEPPEHLVVTGLYRYSRNPIFVADVAILLGLFLYRGEVALLLYAGLFVGLIHIVIVAREEPELRDRFGDEYMRYTRAVPRWIGILRP